MDMDFSGKVAVVTGAGNGIGRATALAFAKSGAKVVVVDRDIAGGEATAGIIRQQGGEVRFVAADVTKSADVQGYVKAALDAYGRIDCFFNNAGIEGTLSHTAEYDEAMFDQVIGVNVKGVFFTIQKALPLMVSGSAIVLNASINGHIAMPNASVYAATKAAVLSLAKNISEETVSRGIRINTVSPGPIESALLARNLNASDLKQTNDWIVSQVPMKRFGKPEDIAAAVLYLTAPESSFVIASDLVVDGGMSTL